MGKQTKPKTEGPTAPRQFRLGEDTLAELDTVAGEYGLSSRTEAVRFLARKEAKRIREKSRKSD